LISIASLRFIYAFSPLDAFRRVGRAAPGLTVVVKYDNIEVLMTRATRPISWVSPALKEFGKFPEGAQAICLATLTIAAEGGKCPATITFAGGDN
jgi:hypothetical protein